MLFIGKATVVSVIASLCCLSLSSLGTKAILSLYQSGFLAKLLRSSCTHLSSTAGMSHCKHRYER